MNRKETYEKAQSRDCSCVLGKDRDNNYKSCIDEVFDYFEGEKPYVAVFETSEYLPEPENPLYEGKSWEEILDTMVRQPLDFNKKQKPLKMFIEQEISEETFKFIENIANIEKDYYGENTYVINNIKFKIHKNEAQSKSPDDTRDNG